MKVACVAPLPRLAIGAMAQLTRYTVEPYFVSDDSWPTLLASYGVGRDWRADARRGAVRDVHDAAARIARAAEKRRDLRLVHARCDPYMLVRLEADDGSEDLLLSVPE